MTPTDTNPGVKKRRVRTTSKEEIQEKAIELFLKKGYHGTSTTDICKALGISQPTLYWYFKDKEDLLFSIHRDAIQESFQPMIERVKAESDPLQLLRAFIREFTREICSNPGAKVLVAETEYLSAEHAAWVKENWKDELTMIRGAIAQLQRDGKAKEVPEAFSAMALIGMIIWSCHWFDYSRPQNIDELARTVEEFFFPGF